MLSKYINTTKKKFVATTLVLTITFSAVSFTPYHSYDSTLLKATAIETQNNDEWQTLNNEADALEEEYYALESELEALGQKEASVSENTKQRLNAAIKELKSEVNDAYNNDKYDDIERINKINSAITSLEHAIIGWANTGETSMQGYSIYKTLMDTFTDNSKDLLDEIFDSSSSFEESKELVDVLINNLCESVERIEDLTATLIDPQNRKAEIKNRMAEIEQRSDEIELQLEKFGPQSEAIKKEENKSVESQILEDEDDLDTLEDEYYELESELEALKQKETSAAANAKYRFDAAVREFETDVDDACNNEQYKDIERFNKINLAISNLESATVMWTITGEESMLGYSIFKNLIDAFTDSSKDLLDEIFDNSKSFEESKKLIDVLVNSLCENVEKIENITSSLVDPQNRKAEIKNRMAEIEQLSEELE